MPTGWNAAHTVLDSTQRAGARTTALDHTAMSLVPDNQELAELLERVAALLATQEVNPFRVRAWRNAAAVVRAHTEPIAELWKREGDRGLVGLPSIGASLAAAIGEYLSKGRLGLLDRLEGEVGSEELVSTVPGIGPTLAERIHTALHPHDLEELEIAAHDGRLASLRGIGDRRLKAIQDSLAGILRRDGRRRARRRMVGARNGKRSGRGEPPVRLILAIDADYRTRAAAGDLPRIAPRRFNPDHEAWLPILHAEDEGWSITALFSNTARAHELRTTHDWVVIVFEREGVEHAYTVVTEHNGPLAGERVVRGREAECSAPVSAAAAGGHPGSGSERPPTGARSFRASPGSPTPG